MPSRVLVAVRVAATPARAFEIFTQDIASWWRPSRLFQFTALGFGELRFEPGQGGRLIEIFASGDVFEVGKIFVWEPPSRLAFSWRQETFAPGQLTEVLVSFEPVGQETRVTVEHLGWDSVPQEHVARHTFPNDLFLLRHGEWWQTLLSSLQYRIAQEETGPKHDG